MHMMIYVLLMVLTATVSLCAVIFLVKVTRQLKGQEAHLFGLRQNQDRLDALIRDESAKSRQELSANVRHNREEVASSLRLLGDSLLSRMTEVANSQLTHLSNLTQANEQKL